VVGNGSSALPRIYFEAEGVKKFRRWPVDTWQRWTAKLVVYPMWMPSVLGLDHGAWILMDLTMPRFTYWKLMWIWGLSMRVMDLTNTWLLSYIVTAWVQKIKATHKLFWLVFNCAILFLITITIKYYCTKFTHKINIEIILTAN